MGILDDAIREHLELKRRHGVPEEELQRQEEEALGPARRDVAHQHEAAEPTPAQTATAEADEPEAPAAEDETALFDMERTEVGGAHPSSATPVEEPPSPAIAHEETAIHEPPPVDEPVPEEQPAMEPTASEPTPVEPPAVEPPPADRHAALGDTQPHGFEAIEDEDELEDEDEGEAEPDAADDEREPDEEELLDSEQEEFEDEDPDVLEDTPDFLQETPEHDRLWFEQKPPRDFDFD
jgi:hypothetical protein